MQIRPFEADCWGIRRVKVMNPALRGIEVDFGPEHADPFRRDLRADPPLSDSDWFRKDHDLRWQSSRARSTAKGSPQGDREGVDQFGVPPKCNANFAWVQQFIRHLTPHRQSIFARPY